MTDRPGGSATAASEADRRPRCKVRGYWGSRSDRLRHDT